MRRKSGVFTLTVLLLGLFGGSSFLLAAAQDASTDSWQIPGFEALGTLNDPSLAPGMILELQRLTWEPGFTVAMHTHNANDVIYVLSGQVAWAVENGSAQVSRAAVASTPGPVEMLDPGAETVLGAGDSITFDYPKIGLLHAARVVGDVPVVMLIASVYDPTKPLTVFPDDAGTPVS